MKRMSPYERKRVHGELINQWLAKNRKDALPKNLSLSPSLLTIDNSSATNYYPFRPYTLGDYVALTYGGVHAFKIIHIAEKFVYLEEMSLRAGTSHIWGMSSYKVDQPLGIFVRVSTKLRGDGKLQICKVNLHGYGKDEDFHCSY